MQGIIVYTRDDAKRNWWFIQEMERLLKEKGVVLSLAIEEELPYSQDIDFVIYRGRNADIVRAFEKRGIRVFNNSKTNEIANDKFLTYKLAKELGLSPLWTTDCIEEIKEYPIIMKTVDGHGGSGVFKCSTQIECNETLKQYPDKRFIYQTMCDEPGIDMRVYVVGTEPIVAIKRTSKTDWRSNYSLGGEAEEVNIPKDVFDACVKISKHLCSDFIGIDFIRNNGQWVINEIEDPVGCRMVYHHSKCDIFEHFASFIVAM